MTTENTPQSDSQKPVLRPGAVADAGLTAEVDLIAKLNSWIDSDLESLVEKHSDWHTPNSNRKHFGR